MNNIIIDIRIYISQPISYYISNIIDNIRGHSNIYDIIIIIVIILRTIDLVKDKS